MSLMFYSRLTIGIGGDILNRTKISLIWHVMDYLNYFGMKNIIIWSWPKPRSIESLFQKAVHDMFMLYGTSNSLWSFSLAMVVLYPFDEALHFLFRVLQTVYWSEVFYLLLGPQPYAQWHTVSLFAPCGILHAFLFSLV